MELREIVQAVRKHWIVASIGFVIACGLGVTAYQFRSDSQYTSTSTIFVTQRGFPYASSTQAGTGVDPGLLSALAYAYSQLAESDAIRRSIGAPINSIRGAVLTTGSFSTGNPLPFIQITGVAKTASGAQVLATAATRALQRYVQSGQSAAATPPSERVQLQVISAPLPGKPVAARTRVVILPGVVFMTILLATLGFIFILENASRRPEAVTKDDRGPGDSPAHGNWPQHEPVERLAAEASSGSAFLRRK
jgi:hypothetical protein